MGLCLQLFFRGLFFKFGPDIFQAEDQAGAALGGGDHAVVRESVETGKGLFGVAADKGSVLHLEDKGAVRAVGRGLGVMGNRNALDGGHNVCHVVHLLQLFPLLRVKGQAVEAVHQLFLRQFREAGRHLRISGKDAGDGGVLGVVLQRGKGALHVKFNISKLLAGIIVMTALLSVTLALTKLLTATGLTTTIFSFRSEKLQSLFGGETAMLLGTGGRDYMILIIELVFVIAVKLLIDLFLKTKLGYMLRATGDNEKLVISLGKDSGTYKILGIAVANGFVAMSGALYANLYTQYDNSCGSGKVVMALASVIVGMTVFSRVKFINDTTAVIFGAVIYSLCLNYLVLVDTNGIYLKLLNAVMFALILIFNEKTSGLVSKHSRLKGGQAK